MKIPYKALLLSPYVLFLAGLACNAAVTFANGHQMPVYPPTYDCSLLDPRDVVHVCMNAHTHLKFLGDLFVSNDGVASIGDLFMDFATMIHIPAGIAWIVLVVRDIFKKY